MLISMFTSWRKKRKIILEFMLPFNPSLATLFFLLILTFLFTKEMRTWKPFDIITGSLKPELRVGHTATYDPTMRCIYIFGGSKKSKWFHDVYMFDLDESKWSLVKVSAHIDIAFSGGNGFALYLWFKFIDIFFKKFVVVEDSIVVYCMYTKSRTCVRSLTVQCTYICIWCPIFSAFLKTYHSIFMLEG